jgi:hypothetical protein
VPLPPELWEVLTLSFMNLGTVLAGFFVGRRADQAQKIVVGAFASGIAGVAFAGLLLVFGFSAAHPRALAGVFVLSFVLGIVWTWIGFISRKSPRTP